MTDSHFDKTCCFFKGMRNRCRRKKRGAPCASRSLAEACSCGRLKVCRVNGDRKNCARMAHLGLLPGTEIELLCKGGGDQCMVKINGGTISLDRSIATQIMVAPV
ncbi:FeoA family protein [Desulfogranum mediterraneum]|uniref:FeoA family protein n=1 Tax=Desulfogranum mediterraneum TaxID=160661 RepID=UPI0003FB786A|nr:FeoA family protein [Desulfogranum mediterraneum]